MADKNMMSPLIRFLLAASLILPLLAAGGEVNNLPGKPQGKNCELLAPPPDAGEEGGHGYLLQVSPRTKYIDSAYSGCQAVFWTTATTPAQLAWLVEVVHGDPVRRWSPDRAGHEVFQCTYARGQLVNGDPDTCPASSELLMPTQAPGCLTARGVTGHCSYDVEKE